MTSDGRHIARAFRELAFLLQLKGENPFKTRAYELAAQRFEGLPPERLDELVARGALQELPGVGEAIATKATALYQTGQLPLLDRLRGEFPPGILELGRVPGLGPRKIAALHRALGIGSIAELAEACRQGRVRGLEGFGEKSEAKLLASLSSLESRDVRRPLAEALPVAEALAARLRSAPGVARAEVAGSVRRFKETVGDLDIVVAAPAPGPVFDALLASSGIREVLGRGDTKCSVVLSDGLQVDVRVLPVAAFATALHHFTGSKAHHVRLRGLAQERGYKLSEWGLEPEGGQPVPVASEEALYRALGLPFIPPEMREDSGEIEAALEGRLPAVIAPADLRGLVHVHSRFSDGTDGIAQLARAARELGYGYLTITDHSRSAGYAGGLDETRLLQQWDEMDRVQDEVPEVRLLRGAEVDILEDGSLDYPDALLERLEVVVVSVHSRLQLDEAQMTRRLLRALEHPRAQILGHPTGRLIGRREPSAVRIDEVLDAAARFGVAVEVNGNPERLDLCADHVREACARGVRLVATSDAHSAATLGHVRFSVGTLRRGWARTEDVLNCLEAPAFLASLRSK